MTISPDPTPWRARVARLAGRARRAARRVARRERSTPGARVDHPICDSLEGWVATHPGAERRVLDPAFRITRSLPHTIEPEIDPAFLRVRSYDVPERALVTVPRARIRGRVGLVILPTGEFVGEVVALTAHGRRELLGGEPAYSMPLPRDPEVRPGSYYPVLGLGVDHYYHWGHDIVMRMRGIGEVLPPDTRLLVPERMRPFQVEMLELVGLDRHPQVPFPDEAFWELERLHVVTPLLKAQIDSREPYEWFRDRARAKYGLRPAEPTRRLLLSRRADNHWRTTNEAEVEAFLAPLGFETVAPATLGFRDQVELFGRAAVIVGAGAGLFNMTFAPPGLKVLQFQERAHTELALWMMADALGVEYHYLVGDAVPNPLHPHVDIHVPIPKLAASLHAMGLC